jgi:hypothetical protein
MTDYCLKNLDQAEFDGLMLLTGLGEEDEDGNVVAASPEVLIDRIGPITMGEVTYPEYYSNLRLLVEPTEEQVEALAPFAIDPSAPQYRTWA